ncbi:MAG: ImmA/IrrE family metallo-endopeptidase [Peptococcaceae bacterium]|nr:ImmA/IrrE family metallo-endopeptidase [Peptococcaceae bacterium]
MDEKIKDLWKKSEAEGIEVRYADLHGSDPELDGLYLWLDGLPVILLDKSLKTNRQLFRCVFAEEIGHYYTAARSNLLIVHPSYADTLRLSRDEYRAMCWATDYLIPDDELVHAVQNLKLKSFSDLVEYFDVTHSFLMYKLAIMTKCQRKKGLNNGAGLIMEKEEDY